MRREILASIAALLLLTACQSSPSTTADAVNAGAGAGAGQGVAQAPVTTAPGGGGAAPAPRTGTAAGTADQFMLEVGDRVFFDFDQFTLTPQARATLERQAAWLRQYPSARITVEGHCDERGTREYNLALGERRANAVVAFLVQLGVNANRIATVSYGKERPIALGSNETSWGQNRRGVTVVQSGAVFN